MWDSLHPSHYWATATGLPRTSSPPARGRSIVKTYRSGSNAELIAPEMMNPLNGSIPIAAPLVRASSVQHGRACLLLLTMPCLARRLVQRWAIESTNPTTSFTSEETPLVEIERVPMCRGCEASQVRCEPREEEPTDGSFPWKAPPSCGRYRMFCAGNCAKDEPDEFNYTEMAPCGHCGIPQSERKFPR